MKLSNIEIVLVEPIYPGNVGAIARSANNYGIETIKIIGELDYLSLPAKKMALYGFDLLKNAQQFNNLNNAVKECNYIIGTVHQERVHRQPPKPVWDVMKQLPSTGKRIALVFGREDNGLTRDEIDICHALAVIPTDEHKSFNLAHSVTVCLYEIHKSLTQVKQPNNTDKLPTQKQYEELIDHFNNMLHEIQFIKGDLERSTMTSMREIMYKANISTEDIPLIHAVLYKIEKVAQKVSHD